MLGDTYGFSCPAEALGNPAILGRDALEKENAAAGVHKNKKEGKGKKVVNHTTFAVRVATFTATFDGALVLEVRLV